MILIFKHVFFRFWENYFYNSKWHISVRKSSPNDEIHSNYMTGNDYSFTGNDRKMFPFCINLPKDLIVVHAKVQSNILSGWGVINFGILFRLIAQCVYLARTPIFLWYGCTKSRDCLFTVTLQKFTLNAKLNIGINI